LIPEFLIQLLEVCRKIKERSCQGKSYSLVIVLRGSSAQAGEPQSPIVLGQSRYGGIGQYLLMKFVAVAVLKRESQF